MKKPELSREEMNHRYYQNLFRSFLLVLVSTFPFVVGIVTSVTATTILWKIVGLALIIIAISFTISALAFSIVGSYWRKKSLEEPDWVKNAKEKWGKKFVQQQR